MYGGFHAPFIAAARMIESFFAFLLPPIPFWVSKMISWDNF